MCAIVKTSSNLKKVWDLKEQRSSLYNYLCDVYPQLKLHLDVLSCNCPIASTCRDFKQGDFFRLRGHSRSFCKKVEDGTFVFKGTEPLSDDFISYYQQENDSSLNGHINKIEHFLMLEHEVFLALTLKNALACAKITKQFVVDYLDKVKDLPRVPIPLFVFMLPQDVTNSFLNKTQEFLLDAPQHSAYDYHRKLVKEGLAIYVYFYPGHPQRAGHFLGNFSSKKNDEKTYLEDLQSNKKSDLIAIASNWIKLTATMLGVGYLPTTWLYTGNCLQIQNLVMDGGMCDIDSVEPISKLNSSYDLARSVLICIQTLTSSISQLTDVRQEAIFAIVWNMIADEIRENPHDLNFDQRITKLFLSDGLDLIANVKSQFGHKENFAMSKS